MHKGRISPDDPVDTSVYAYIRFTHTYSSMAFNQFIKCLIFENELMVMLMPQRNQLRNNLEQFAWAARSKREANFNAYINNVDV
jgi:hypothetical protein